MMANIMRMVRGLTAVLLSLCAFSSWALSTGERVDNFRLLDHQGGSQELYYFADAKALVLMAHSARCASAAEAFAQFNNLQAQFAGQDVEFMLLNAGEERTQISASAQVHDLRSPVLMDVTQIISESLALTTAGEMLIVEPGSWTLRYRGNVHAGADALKKIVAGEQPGTAQTQVEGCAIELPGIAQRQQHANISYAQTIAPMLQDNCVTCHRVGGIGPWAMTDYNMIRGFSLMIREVVRTQRMPPWHADPHYGEFANDRSLSPEQVSTLVHWIEAGAPRGEGTDPLVEDQRTYPLWGLGEPDVIIEIPAEEVPATGVVDYKYKMVENPLNEDVWVRATEILPGDRSVLHHVITRFGELETAGPRAGRLKRRGGGGLGGYVPGAVAREYPDHTGTFLPAGATIEFQMHYTTSGKPATDVSRLGLYLHKEPPNHRYQGLVFINPRIKIPAGAAAHAEVAERMIDENILVYGMLPHAHYRGKASEFVAHYPDGRVEKLISVPHYDFNWQTTYHLQEPKMLPAGTRIVHRTWWDNSARNPANPDPDRVVPWGRQSWDEMLFGVLNYRVLDDAEMVTYGATDASSETVGGD